MDVETSDGGVPAINYFKLKHEASKHDYSYVTVDEYCECFF